MKFFRVFSLLLVCLLSFGVVSAAVYNQAGDFTVTIENLEAVVVNENIQTEFTFTIENNKATTESVSINYGEVRGWDLEMEPSSFNLAPQESREITFSLAANSDFDYSENVVSPNEIFLSKDSYRGLFEFPIEIQGEDERVTAKFNVEIIPLSDVEVDFEPRITEKKLSPISDLTFSIEASEVPEEQFVSINVYLGEEKLREFVGEFSNSAGAYQVFSQEVPSTFAPGQYDARIVIRQEKAQGNAEEWFAQRTLEVVPYNNIVVEEETSSSLFKEETTLRIVNEGNQADNFTKEIETSFFKGFFFSSSSDSVKNDGVRVLSENLDRGESKVISYSYNYLPIYVILFVILVLVLYIYVRKNSNPLDVETKVYGIKRVKHEGIKEMKVRFGFENIKVSKIDVLKITFRMPAYLHVKEDSFVLTEPNHVLKGTTQYKLIWEFRKFEKHDSRIIGFTLLNKRGVLGDIRFGQLEFEVTVDGKTRKYYESFPTIRG